MKFSGLTVHWFSPFLLQTDLNQVSITQHAYSLCYFQLFGINLQQHNHISTSHNHILALLTLYSLPHWFGVFQNKPNSAFQAHSITIKVAVASLLAFVLALGIDFTFHSSSAALLCTRMVFSNSLSHWLSCIRCMATPSLCHLCHALCWHLACPNRLYSQECNNGTWEEALQLYP